MKRLNFTNANAREIARLRRMKGPVEVLERDEEGDGLHDLPVVKLARRNGSGADGGFSADELSPKDFL
jgi:hypothetical protein